EFGFGAVDVGAGVGDDAIGGLAVASAEEALDQQRTAARHADDGVVADRFGAWAIRDELERGSLRFEEVHTRRHGMLEQERSKVRVLLHQVLRRRHYLQRQAREARTEPAEGRFAEFRPVMRRAEEDGAAN